MKRNETSARGASKHAPVKNAGSRRLRSLTAAAFIVMTGIGLAWHTGWGTLSSLHVQNNRFHLLFHDRSSLGEFQ